MQTVYELLLSLRNAAEQLVSSSAPEDVRASLDPPGEVKYEEAKRFADFPFQCYPASYWPHRPHPSTDNIHENFAWIYRELRRGLEAMDHGEIADRIGYWHHSYVFRWGHHASAAIWAIEWHKDGDKFDWRIIVPANTTATVYVPVPSAEQLSEDDTGAAPQSSLISAIGKVTGKQ